jgi:hypothetical protein
MSPVWPPTDWQAKWDDRFRKGRFPPLCQAEVRRMREPSAKLLPAVGLMGCLLLGACAPAQTSGAATGAHAKISAPREWHNATYRLTCDGIVPGGFDAKLVNGAAHVPAEVSETPDYLSFDVHLEATATGDLNGDRRPDTVVLLQCSPQPSNAFVQEVEVFSADGSRLGELPSPRTLQGTAILPPLYVAGGLTVAREDVVAAMKAYGPDDSHATGPSMPITVRWHWDGKAFARAS